MSGRSFALGIAALLIVRICLTAHAPSFVDAHVCLAALALSLVAGAPRAAQIAAALLTLGVVTSIPTSYDPWVSLLALPAIVGPVAFLLLASSGSCREGLLVAAGLGGAVNAVAVLVQKTITWPDALARMDEIGLNAAHAARLAEARPIGLSLSPDLAGGLCLAGAFCAAALAFDVAQRAQRAQLLVLVATTALCAAGLVVVRSFGCALALVVGVTVATLLLGARRSSARAATLGLSGLLMAALSLAVALMMRGIDALHRSADERSENWRAALDVFAEAPLFGVGLMRFGAAYLQVRAPEMNVTRYAHSGPLQLLAETGLLGGLLGAAALVVVARALWQRRSSLLPSDCVLAGGAAACLLRACIDYDLQIAQSASVFAVLIGLLIARADPAPAAPMQRRVLAAVTLLTLPLVVVLGVRQGIMESADAVALDAYIDKLPLDAEPRIARGAQAVDALVVCSDHESCVAARTSAFAALDPLCARRQPQPVALVLRARAYATIGHLEQALNDADRALQVDRGSPTAHQLGVSLAQALQRNDVDARIAAARAWHVSLEEAAR